MVQLYDMSKDLGEQSNLAKSNPEKVASLRKLLEDQVAAGRTTPGPKQANDAEIKIEKSPGAGGGKKKKKDKKKG